MTEALQFPSDRPAGSAPLLADRFRPRERLDSRGAFERWSAEETAGVGPIVLISEPTPDAEAPGSLAWPSLAWEEDLRQRAGPLGLSRVLDRFTERDRDWLALEVPAGVTLWDVWDEPTYGAAERYGWLGQLAELLRTIHRAGAILESLRPEQVRISPLGQVLLDPTVVLLPLPLPRSAPVRPTIVSAPELIEGQG